MNNKGADQTAQMRRLICAFVVRICHKQFFSWHDLYWTHICSRTLSHQHLMASLKVIIFHLLVSPSLKIGKYIIHCCTVLFKNPKNWDSWNCCHYYSKISDWSYYPRMCLKDAGGRPWYEVAVWSEFALVAQTYLSHYFRTLIFSDFIFSGKFSFCLSKEVLHCNHWLVCVLSGLDAGFQKRVRFE